MTSPAQGETASTNSDVSPAAPRSGPSVPLAKLRQELRGDLDNIVLMALRKEPQHRYASVEQFATDIQRHLDNLPVIATKGTARYRASKFIRRHKTGVLAALSLAVALVAGLAATLYEARIARFQELRAERRFNDVRKLAHSMMFEIHDSIRDLPGSTAARKLLVDRALQYLDSLSTESVNDPSLLRELAFAYERVGDVQGYFYNSNLGDTAGAMKSYQKALAIRETLARNNPNDPSIQSELAASLGKVADALYSIGDKSGSTEKNRQVLAIRQALVAADPSSENARWYLASAQVALGDSLVDISDWTAAAQEYKEGLSVYEQLSAEHAATMRYHRMVAITRNKLGFVSEHDGDLKSAARQYHQGLQIFQQLFASDPTNTLLQRNLALAYLNTGDVGVATGDPHGILDLLEAARLADAISAKDPSNRRIDRDISMIYAHLGDAEKKKGKTSLALQYYSRGVEAALRRAASDPENVDAAESLADRYQSLGGLYAIIAADHKTPASRRHQLWQQAHSDFQKALSFWLDPNRARQTTAPPGMIEDLQRSLRQADAALAAAR
jgi:tetratricopeptide (TPR) repeat protein